MTSPLEQCRDALREILAYAGSPERVYQTGKAALAAAEAALQQESATFSAATILPDGSAFATASWPLPKDHWLYAPRGEWDSVRDEYSECPAPILNNSHAQAVRAAVKYAVRGATMCGQDMDFDPDAMVQNSVYALCGPANAAVLPVDAQGEPVAWVQLGMRNGHTYVRMHYEGHLYPPPPDVQRNLNLVPLYAAPVAVQPLPERFVAFALRDLRADRKRLDGFLALGNEVKRAAEYDEWIAALEAYCAAHGIAPKEPA